MPKVNASLADISTEYVLIEPAVYEMEVDEVSAEINADAKHPDSGEPVTRVAHTIKSKVVTPGEHFGKPVFHTMYIHTKKGEPNAIALAELKRYFEACAPEEADAEDPDTDVLKGRRFQAEVIIDSYTKQGESQPRQVNKLNPRSIQAI